MKPETDTIIAALDEMAKHPTLSVLAAPCSASSTLKLAAERLRDLAAATEQRKKLETLNSQLDGELVAVRDERDAAREEASSLLRENLLLQAECDGACNAEELRQVRAELSALRRDKVELLDALRDAQPLAIAWVKYWTTSPAYGNGEAAPVHTAVLAKIDAAMAKEGAPVAELITLLRCSAVAGICLALIGCSDPQRPTVTVVQFSATGEIVGHWRHCTGVWNHSSWVAFIAEDGTRVQISGQFQIVEEKGVEQ